MPDVVLYTRVSKDRTSRRKSVTEQDDAATLAAAAMGWTIAERFVDNDRSASRFATRPRVGWPALLEHLATRDVHALMIWELSRADRRMGPFVDLLDLLRARGILLHVIKDDQTYDPRKARDRKALLQEGIAAESESEQTSERVLRSARALAVAGKPTGRVIYGHRRIYGDSREYVRTELDPVAAAEIRRMADTVLAGGTLRQVADDLNTRGVASPNGGRWVPWTVRQILLNPAYAARRVHQGQVIGKADWPPVFDDDVYDRLVAKLTDPSRRTTESSTLTYMLSGAAVCYFCRTPLRTIPGRTQRLYRCPATGCLKVAAPIAAMDAVVSTAMVGWLRRRSAAAVFLPAADPGALARAEARVKELQDAMDGHYEEAENLRLSAAGLARMEAKLLPQIEAAEAEVRRLSVPPALDGVDLDDLAERWYDKPVRVRRSAILAMAEVVLGPAGKGVRFSHERLGDSRWHGDPLTWRDHWA